jgi:AcrR family transcriptional regulator
MAGNEPREESRHLLTAATRPAGRPRRAATDAAIARAAVELMAEVGVEGTTLTAVARRAGVARATVYLRWPTRSALIGAAARGAVGGTVMPVTGDLEHDLRFAAQFIRRLFEVPTFAAILPEIIRGALANPPELAFETVAPRRRVFREMYRDGAAEAGLDPTLDPDLPFDVLLGAAIVRLLATRAPMTEETTAQLAEVLVRGLRRP